MARVMIHGLVNACQYNDSVGTIEREEDGRVVVKLDDFKEKLLKVPMKNLRYLLDERTQDEYLRAIPGADGFVSRKVRKIEQTKERAEPMSLKTKSGIARWNEQNEERQREQESDGKDSFIDDEEDDEIGADEDNDFTPGENEGSSEANSENDEDGDGDEEEDDDDGHDEDGEEEDDDDDGHEGSDSNQFSDVPTEPIHSGSKRQILKPKILVMNTKKQSYEKQTVKTQVEDSASDSQDYVSGDSSNQHEMHDETLDESSFEEDGDFQEARYKLSRSARPIDLDNNNAAASVVARAWREAGFPALCNIEKFVKEIDAHILRGQGMKINYQAVPEEVAGGNTQVGKTGFKALVALTAKRRNVLTVVVTTTVDVNYKLADDLEKNYFSRINDAGLRPLCLSLKKPRGHRSANHSMSLQKCIHERGVLVVNCTKHAIQKVIDLIARYRGLSTRSCLDFVLVKDESDTMSRTLSGELQLEQALDQLTGKKGLGQGFRLDCPLLILNISATLLPVFLRLHEEGKCFHETTFGDPKYEEYSGLENMEPICGTFLVDDELSLHNNFWRDNVAMLYDDAHPENCQQQKHGVLLLDAVNPRVLAENNSTDRAEFVIEKYPRFSVLVVWGCGGIKAKLPGENWMEGDSLLSFVQEQFGSSRISRNDKVCGVPTKVMIGDVLSAVSCKQGFTSPIVVIGYSRMLRGDSFRTSVIASADGLKTFSIVPTHMLCGLARRWSLDNFVQMMGRATFVGKDILQRNGHEKVKMLTHWKDWDNAHAYLSFQRELADRIASHGIKNALSNHTSAYSAKSNLDDLGDRTIGPRRRDFQLEVPFQKQFVGQGRSWLVGQNFVHYSRHGHEFRLDSPFTETDRESMTDSEEGVEQVLYHGRFLQIIDALVVRREIMQMVISGSKSPCLDHDEWQERYLNVPYLSSTKEKLAITNGRKTLQENFYEEEIKASPKSLPIFEKNAGSGLSQGNNSGNEENFALSQPFTQFAQKFSSVLCRKPPVYNEGDLQQFLSQHNAL